jgi:hypothetical protein
VYVNNNLQQIKTITAETKTKQECNIAIYLSNEDRFRPLLLAMFCQISKIAQQKKIGKSAEE